MNQHDDSFVINSLFSRAGGDRVHPMLVIDDDPMPPETACQVAHSEATLDGPNSHEVGSTSSFHHEERTMTTDGKEAPVCATKAKWSLINTGRFMTPAGTQR